MRTIKPPGILNRHLLMTGKQKKSTPLSIFVSIGAGRNQVPLIREAKKLGYYLVGVDRDPRAEGIPLCDIKIHESIDNYREIYKKLQEVQIYGDIAGILSRSHGKAVKSACYLADRFNLPLMPFRRVEDFINKKRMKTLFLRRGIPSPGYRVITAPADGSEESGLEYPFVVKPVTGHAKTGVRLIRNRAELRRHLKSRSPDESGIIAERFIAGDELIAAGIVHQGRYYLVSISDKAITPPPHFVDLAHTAPSRRVDLWKRLSGMGQRVAEAFDIFTSPLIMEVIITPGDGLFLIEAVPEFGGEFIPDLLVPLSTGYNFISEAIKAVSGGGFSPPPEKKVTRHVAVRYITGRPGRIISCVTPRRRSPDIRHLELFKPVGSPVSAPATNHDRIGVVVATGRSRQSALAAAEKAVAGLHIVIGEH